MRLCSVVGHLPSTCKAPGYNRPYCKKLTQNKTIQGVKVVALPLLQEREEKQQARELSQDTGSSPFLPS